MTATERKLLSNKLQKRTLNNLKKSMEQAMLHQLLSDVKFLKSLESKTEKG